MNSMIESGDLKELEFGGTSMPDLKNWSPDLCRPTQCILWVPVSIPLVLQWVAVPATLGLKAHPWT